MSLEKREAACGSVEEGRTSKWSDRNGGIGRILRWHSWRRLERCHYLHSVYTTKVLFVLFAVVLAGFIGGHSLLEVLAMQESEDDDEVYLVRGFVLEDVA